MDPWKEQSAWQAGREKLRQWAALEGKSAAMSEDLYRSQAERDSLRRKSLSAASICAHVGFWLLEVWRFFRSG